jgi:tetrahydromethanopterin S-methyltransferase subunit B
VDSYDKRKLDSVSEQAHKLEVRVAEISRELAHMTQLLDEHRKNVRTIMLRLNATFITGLLSVIGVLISALFYN